MCETAFAFGVNEIVAVESVTVDDETAGADSEAILEVPLVEEDPFA